MHKISNGNINN